MNEQSEQLNKNTNMTNVQTNEARKSLEKLGEARQYLDNAMYRLGQVDTNDPYFQRYREAYDLICQAIDLIY